MKRFAEERNHTVAQLAVAWTLANPAVDVAIVGARRPAHIEGTVPAAEFDLSEDDLREIENIMQGAVMVGGPSQKASSTTTARYHRPTPFRGVGLFDAA